MVFVPRGAGSICVCDVWLYGSCYNPYQCVYERLRPRCDAVYWRLFNGSITAGILFFVGEFYEYARVPACIAVVDAGVVCSSDGVCSVEI